MDIRIGVVGATGYAGVELVRLLTRHPCARVTYVTSASRAGDSLDAVYPHLLGFTDTPLVEFDPAEAADACDLVFLARGNGWAMEHAGELLDSGCRVIDIAADFRLADLDVWQEHYGSEHTAEELAAEAVYGLPELHADSIASARLVANPGCYPTSAILALAPAVAGHWVRCDGIIFASASGVSGAGRSRTEVGYLFTEIDENYRAYNVEKHRHTPEIEQELSELAGESIAVTFTPHLAPMVRGIHTTAYACVADIQDGEAIYQAYVDFYQDAPFVRVLPPGQLPATKQVTGSNYCYISPVLLSRTGKLVVTAVIDNLVKGAAGQAIQNMNIMFGLDQTTGLDFPAMYP